MLTTAVLGRQRPGYQQLRVFLSYNEFKASLGIGRHRTRKE